MAGMPLFAHVGREKLIPPPLSVPSELIKFCGSETQNRYLRGSGAAPGWFSPVLLRKTGKNVRLFCSAKQAKRKTGEHFLPVLLRKQAKTRAKPRFCPHFTVLPVCLGFARKINSPPPGINQVPHAGRPA